MLMFAFFTAVFSSTSWLIYAILFVRSKLEAEGLWEQSPEMMLTLVCVVALPILVIWLIFGFFCQFLNNRSMNRKQNELLTQLQKNQDYTDLVVRVMLDAEHEIKDGFVINKFDTLINDMNEALGEVIQRCNIASSAQLDLLWQRVGRGERWSLGKAVLEASKSQSTFDAWVREKVNRDKVFRGSLLEFCSRYQNLLQLLEKHDRDRIFLRMIESGVLGKVYSIIAPLTEGIGSISVSAADRLTAHDTTEQKSDYTSALKLATMEEPKAQNTIVNVDRDDEEFAQDDDDSYTETRPSFLSKLNPFKRRQDDTDGFDEAEQDPFFQALHNSFQGNPAGDSRSEVSLSEPSFNRDEPSFSAAEFKPVELPKFESITQPDPEPSLNAANETASGSTLTASRDEFPSQNRMPSQNTVSEPHFSGTSETMPRAASNDDEDLVYPFGGWTDEKNYR